MHFSSYLNMPPYEEHGAFLQVTVGCSHRKCPFCTFFNEAPFRISPMEEVEADIKELAENGCTHKRIFLQAGNPLILPYDRMMAIADLVHKYLPTVETIGGYARIDDIENKTVEQLRDLRKAGYCNFYFGNETGDNDLLDLMQKGYHVDKVIEMLSRLDEAGMEYVMNFLGGLGGHNYGLRHAQKSAELINKLNPSMIYVSELTLFPDTPLSRSVEKGEYVEATELERLEELAELISDITIPTVFMAEHVSNPVPIRGRLPEDREKMLSFVGNLAEKARTGYFDNFRKRIVGL